MRVAILILLLCCACGHDEPPPAVGASGTTGPAQERAAATPARAVVDVLPEAHAPEAKADAVADAATAASVRSVLASAAAGDAAAQGRAVTRLVEIGRPAVPALGDALAAQDVATRRIAVLALLQLGADAAPAAAALDRARNDADASVRAAAEHAWRRAVGDTSDLDRLRREHEAAEAARK